MRHPANNHRFVNTMAFVCAISGEIPQIPAVSLVSKSLFEKRLLEKWVHEYGTDPVTKESMTINDIIELKIQPIGRPRAPSATSIPQLLQLLQDEWDSTVLYSHKLSQNMSSLKKELYTTLYQKDAACRVIARQMQDLMETEKAMAHRTFDINAKPTPLNFEFDMAQSAKDAETSQVVVDENIENTAKQLIKNRKKLSRTIPEGLASAESFGSLHQVYENNSLHSPREGKLYSLDLKPNSEFVVTGGADKNLVLFDKESQLVINKVKAHTKKINHVQFHSNEVNHNIISCSADHDISIWNYKEESSASAITKLKIHKSPVVGFDVHPYSNYLLSGEQRYAWCLTDIETRKVVKNGNLLDFPEMGTISSHPDGLIFAGTTTNVVSDKIFIWDLCSCVDVAKFSGDDGSIVSLSFSENGFHLSALQKNNEHYFVSLWDLRKLKSINTITIDPTLKPNTLNYDQSGNYLVVGGNGLKVYDTKTWEVVGSTEIPKSQITCAKFAKNSHSLVTVGLDRYLRYFTV